MGAAKSNKKTIKRFKGIRIAVFVFLILWCSSFYLSSSWIFLNSFKSRIQFLLDKTGWPKPFLFANYPAALNNLEAGGKNLFSMLFNSLWLTFGNISVQVITSVMFAYALARYRFFGRNAMYWTVIVMMMLTIVGALPAQYKLYLNLGIYDTPLIILTGASGTAHFLIYYAAFKGLPWSYAESAFIDGASHLTVFFRIMLPQVNGVITAMCVTSFIINWNEYLTPILFLPSFPTIASGIFIYQKETARQLNAPVLFAAILMSVVPVVAAFGIFQKHFLNIDISGGLKG